MDTEAFIRWALDDARSVDDRYTVELLVEQGVSRWNSKRKIYFSPTLDERIELNRERKLNPAYQPTYSEDELRKAVEYLAVVTSWGFYSDRPIRSLEAVRFLTTLETFSLPHHCEVADFSALAELPSLRGLTIGHPGGAYTHFVCEDYTFLARCAALRELVLGFNARWPDLTGIETLTQLESLTLSGNLLAMPPHASFPNVRRAHLHCMPLAARDVASLPQFPVCEFLTLYGVERLDGIEKMPALRNLTVRGPFRSFAPLTALPELTCLTVEPLSHLDPPLQPRDVAPLAKLPKLVHFTIGSELFTPENQCLPDMPRDYSPLVEAPALRELTVRACPPVEMEVAAINAGLLPWDDLFLLHDPRPLQPLRMILAPHEHQPQQREEHRGPGETGLIDIGLRECEGRWVGRFAQKFIDGKIGHADWGKVVAVGVQRSLRLTVESFEVVERLPEIIDWLREVMAKLRHEYIANVYVGLKIPPPKASPALRQLQEQFREEQDRWEFEQEQRDRKEYLERLHQLELKKQQGAEIDPNEFSPTEPEPYPEPPAMPEPESEPRDCEDDGGIAVEKAPEPPQSIFQDDDEHPLASNYNLMANLTPGEIWFLPHHRGIAMHLMRREPDLEIAENPKPGE